MLFVAVSTVNAQSVTYIHENDIMNQFLTMETGAGALTPAAYYNTFHKSYQRDANVRNKLIYRTSVMAAVNEEKAPAEKIDSDYVARAKIEALNIESRSKATDITWFSEKAKINGKLEIFNRNISRIVTSGGTSEDYRTWRNIYNCIETAIKYTQDSYLDMGQRKKEFLAIYRDIMERRQKSTRTACQQNQDSAYFIHKGCSTKCPSKMANSFWYRWNSYWQINNKQL